MINIFRKKKEKKLTEKQTVFSKEEINNSTEPTITFNKEEVNNLIEKITKSDEKMLEDILKKCDVHEFPNGLSLKTIEDVAIECNKCFNCNLPEGYALFLKEANGLCCNYFSIFCCYNEEIEKKFPGYTSLEFFTYNDNFQNFTDIEDFLILGVSSLDYICYKKDSKMYQVITNGTMDLILEDENFFTLLNRYIKSQL